MKVEPDRTRLQWIATNLWIRTKRGEMVRLQPNKLQIRLHMHMQAQRARGLPVRLSMLKFRQWGGCLDPDTKVLTAGLEWVRIADVRVGDALIGVDEATPGGRGKDRKMRTTHVEGIRTVRRPAYRIEFEDGRSVVCSDTHKWLSKGASWGYQWRSVGVAQQRKKLRVGMSVRSMTEPWGQGDFDCGSRVPITKIVKLGKRNLVDLQTSTQTYIAEGFVSHNSTWFQAEAFYDILHNPNRSAMSVSVDADSTENLFRMVQLYNSQLPAGLGKPMDNTNRKEIIFSAPHRSSFLAHTAGKLSLGRSFTAQYVLASEIAFWADAAGQMAGLHEIVPMDSGTMVVQETTANGVGGYFYDGFMAAGMRRRRFPDDYSSYQPVFFGWNQFPDYAIEPVPGVVFSRDERQVQHQYGLTDAQLYWRQLKLGEKNGDLGLFHQEYPLCVVAGTRVGTRRGILPVEEIRCGDEVSYGAVDHTIMQSHSDIYEMTTSLGYSFRGTGDHPVFSPFGNTVKMKELTVGQSVALSVPITATDMHTVRWTRAGLDCSVTMTPEWGRFLGYFMGDGSYSGKTLSVVCTGTDTDAIKDVSGLVHRLFGLEMHGRVVGNKKGGWELRVRDQRLTEVFIRLGIVEKGPREHLKRKVRVPECIWRSPSTVIIEFLRGLFEADGFSNKSANTVRFFAKYEAFAREVQLLLLSQGITSRMTTVKSKALNGKVYYGHELSLRRQESYRFHRDIGFVSKRKRKEPVPSTLRRPYLLVDEVALVEQVDFDRTYDLTVAGGHAFDANGIKTHNCPAEAFLSSGSPVFAPDIITTQSATLGQAFRHVLFDESTNSIHEVAVDSTEDCWIILDEPVASHDYAMGIDTMEGRLSNLQNPRSDLDHDGVAIIDRNTGRVVAIYTGRSDQKELAQQCYRAAMYYGQAWVAPEIPQGMILLNYFRERGYQNLYNRQEHEDHYVEIESERLGWRTTEISRRWLVEDFVVASRSAELKLAFPEIIEQMQTFVRDARGRPGHMQGEHDDLLFAVMIAWQVVRRCPLGDRPYGPAYAGQGDLVRNEDDGINRLARIGAIDTDEDDEDAEFMWQEVVE